MKFSTVASSLIVRTKWSSNSTQNHSFSKLMQGIALRAVFETQIVMVNMNYKVKVRRSAPPFKQLMI